MDKSLAEEYYPIIVSLKTDANERKQKEFDKLGFKVDHDITETDIRIVLETIDAVNKT